MASSPVHSPHVHVADAEVQSEASSMFSELTNTLTNGRNKSEKLKGSAGKGNSKSAHVVADILSRALLPVQLRKI